MKRVLFIMILFLLIASDGFSQCAMCAATAEEAIRNGSSATASLNKGVMYLFVTPYLIVATIGFFWWRARKKSRMQVQ